MTAHHVLIFGGNGRIARSMTSLMLSRSWKITSVIRSLHQKTSLLGLGKDQPGTIDTLEMDLRDIKTPEDVTKILEVIKPTCVVFAAGMVIQIQPGSRRSNYFQKVHLETSTP
jgi:dTDP-4-dehydrorhamnose reductase